MRGKKNIFISLSVFIAVILIFTSSTLLADNESNISEIREKLDNISEKEKQILEDLFIKFQEIEEMERENKRISQEIDTMKIGIEGLGEKIEKVETNYKHNLNALENILKSYQRMGPASFLDIILNSDNLTDLIRRINIVRDLARNTGNLLDKIEESKGSLILEKSNLAEKLKLLEDKQEALGETLTKKQELVKAQEEYLDSLAEDKELYLERLQYISMIMNELKIIFSDFTKEFAKIIEEGNFPQDAVKETLTLRGVKGIIEEKTFNDIIAAHKGLPQMEFKFSSGKIEMEAPEKNLTLEGKFVIIGDQIIKFEAEKGSFYGMPLEKGTIEDLFEEGYFILNLEPLIGKNILRSVEIMDGYMELLVTVKLF
ncbi:coiled-coil domain-containing protein [Tissierella carlieri]|uniref:coiled-coil domain-containing protein n=1 Tax=Tissierella carlieri TaxID=689904 RepID=UPI00386B3E02